MRSYRLSTLQMPQAIQLKGIFEKLSLRNTPIASRLAEFGNMNVPTYVQPLIFYLLFKISKFFSSLWKFIASFNIWTIYIVFKFNSIIYWNVSTSNMMTNDEQHTHWHHNWTQCQCISCVVSYHRSLTLLGLKIIKNKVSIFVDTTSFECLTLEMWKIMVRAHCWNSEFVTSTPGGSWFGSIMIWWHKSEKYLFKSEQKWS